MHKIIGVAGCSDRTDDWIHPLQCSHPHHTQISVAELVCKQTERSSPLHDSRWPQMEPPLRWTLS